MLSKDDKEHLRNLKEHPGFKVLQRIEQEEEERLKKKFLTANLSDPEIIKTMQVSQIYIQARKDFLQNIDKNLQEIYQPEV